VPRSRFLAEQDLLRAMIAGGEARTLVARELGVDGFGDPRLRVVAGTILAMAEAGTPLTVAQVLDRLPTGEIHQLATRIFFQEVEYRLSAESVAGYIRAIKDSARTARIEQLLTEIRQAQTAGTDPRPLVEEYQQLIRDAKGSKRDG
jgi:replicative DNA helicase